MLAEFVDRFNSCSKPQIKPPNTSSPKKTPTCGHPIVQQCPKGHRGIWCSETKPRVSFRHVGSPGKKSCRILAWSSPFPRNKNKTKSDTGIILENDFCTTNIIQFINVHIWYIHNCSINTKHAVKTQFFLSQQSLNSKCQGVKILCGWVKFKASELQVTWSNLMCWIILRTRFASIYDVLYFNVLCWIYDVVYKLLYLQINDSLVFAPENPKRLGSLPSKLAKVPVPDSWHDSTSWILRKSPRVWGFKWVSSFEYPRPKHPKNGVNSCLSLVGFWADLMQKIDINHLAMASSIPVDPICSSFIPGWSPPQKNFEKPNPLSFAAQKKNTQNHCDPPNWEMAAGLWRCYFPVWRLPYFLLTLLEWKFWIQLVIYVGFMNQWRSGCQDLWMVKTQRLCMFLGYSEYSRFLQVILAQVQIPCPNLDSKVHKTTVNKRIFLTSPNNQKWLQHSSWGHIQETLVEGQVVGREDYGNLPRPPKRPCARPRCCLGACVGWKGGKIGCM